jgi:hypothetical protein
MGRARCKNAVVKLRLFPLPARHKMFFLSKDSGIRLDGGGGGGVRGQNDDDGIRAIHETSQPPSLFFFP